MKEKIKNFIMIIIAVFIISYIFWQVQAYYINKQIKEIEVEIETFINAELEKNESEIEKFVDDQLVKIDGEVDRVESNIDDIQEMVEKLELLINILYKK